MEKNNEILTALYGFWRQVNTNSIHIPGKEVTFTDISYNEIPIDRKIHYVKTDFVIIEPTFMKELNSMELSIIVKIIGELFLNNIFWYCDYRLIGGKFERAILSLRKKGILINTSYKGLHIVNPWFIRRGDIRKVIAASYKFTPQLSERNYVLLGNLKNPKNVIVNLFEASFY